MPHAVRAQYTSIVLLHSDLGSAAWPTAWTRKEPAVVVEVAPQNVGQIQIAIFANEGGLEAVGDNMLLATPASGQAQLAAPGQPGYGQVMQGFIETSNVNAVQEITSLITAQRAYEMNSKVITATDEMLSTLARMR